MTIGDAAVRERRAAPPHGRCRAAPGAAGLRRRVLLPARPAGRQQRRRPADPAAGRASSASATRPASTCREHARAECRRRSWRNDAGVDRPTARSPTDRRGAPATTSTSRSARATCRPTRCRWRSPTRRSPTAARSSRPHSGCAIEDSTGRSLQESTPARAPARSTSSPGTARRSSTACTRPRSEPGGTSTPRLPELPDAVAGKTGTAERVGQADQSWYVALAPYPTRAIVVAVTIERGGFGAEAAAPAARQILAAVLRHQGRGDVHTGRRRTPVSTVATDAGDPSRRRRAASSASARDRASCRLDLLLLLATLGLIACSLVHARRGDARRRPRQPALLRRPPGRATRRRARADAR